MCIGGYKLDLLNYLRWPLLTGSSGGAGCPHMKPLLESMVWHSLLLAGGLARSLGAGAGGIGLARRLRPGLVAREGGDGWRASTVNLGPALAAGSGRVAGLVVAARALRGAFARGILVRRATVAISAGCGGRSRRLGVRAIGGFGPARLARDSAGLGLAVRALVRALVVGVIERGPAIAVSAGCGGRGRRLGVRAIGGFGPARLARDSAGPSLAVRALVGALVVGVIERGPAIAVSAGGGRRLWIRAVLAAAEACLGWDALSAGAVWARSAARAVGVQERCAAEAVRALRGGKNREGEKLKEPDHGWRLVPTRWVAGVPQAIVLRFAREGQKHSSRVTSTPTTTEG